MIDFDWTLFLFQCLVLCLVFGVVFSVMYWVNRE